MNDLQPYMIAAMTTLGTAISILWVANQRQHNRTEKRLDECEEDRDNQASLIHRLAMSLVKHDTKGLNEAVDACTQRIEKKRPRPASD